MVEKNKDARIDVFCVRDLDLIEQEIIGVETTIECISAEIEFYDFEMATEEGKTRNEFRNWAARAKKAKAYNEQYLKQLKLQKEILENDLCSGMDEIRNGCLEALEILNGNDVEIGRILRDILTICSDIPYGELKI